jgi:hypothetical protein
MRVKRLLLLIALLSIATHRLPAPILETQESPTPAPEQSAKPKAKRIVKPKASENSESSTNKRATSPTPKSKATPIQPRLAGNWNGIMDCGIAGVIEHTISIDVALSSMTVWQTNNPSVRGIGSTQVNGDTMTLHYDGCYWTLTPNPDGKTVLVRCACTGLLGIGGFSSSATFHRTSP